MEAVTWALAKNWLQVLALVSGQRLSLSRFRC